MTLLHATVAATRNVTEQRGLEASLMLANAQVADLKEKLAGAAQTERKYLAAELHDDVQQILYGLSLNIQASQKQLLDQPLSNLVGTWVQTVQTAMEHLHEITVVLRKPPVDNQELPGAMRSYLETLSLAPDQEVSFETDAKVGTLAPNIAIACFRIVQEALGNAIKHSGAKHLLVCLERSVNRLTVSIRDDGVGFDVEGALALALDFGSVGLSSMRERAVLAGGHFDIRSSIGHGTRIRASFPIEESVSRV